MRRSRRDRGGGKSERCTPYKSRKQTHNLSLPGSVGAGVFFFFFFFLGSFEGEKKYVKIMMNFIPVFRFFSFFF